MRASSLPSTSCTTLRATCVDSSRSVGVWNVPTFNALECRSAALEVDGANGSWTWQMSSGRIVNRSSIVRDTSTGNAGNRRLDPGRSGNASPTASTRGGAPGSGSSWLGTSTAARKRSRVSRTASCDREDATITTLMSTLCEFGGRSLGVGSMSCVSPPHGYGVTWAIARRSAGTTRRIGASGGANARRRAHLGSSAGHLLIRRGGLSRGSTGCPRRGRASCRSRGRRVRRVRDARSD